MPGFNNSSGLRMNPQHGTFDAFQHMNNDGNMLGSNGLFFLGQNDVRPNSMFSTYPSPSVPLIHSHPNDFYPNLPLNPIPAYSSQVDNGYNSGNISDNTLYMRNLPLNFSQNDLLHILSPIPDIKDIRVHPHKKTGAPVG